MQASTEGVLYKVTLDEEDWLEALLTVGLLKGSTIRLRYCDLSHTIRSSFLPVGTDKWDDEIVATKAEVVPQVISRNRLSTGSWQRPLPQ